MIDYERGLEQFMHLARNTDWFEEATIFEARLLENLNEERYGTTNEITANRMRIIHQLNRLALKHLGITFTDLCRNRRSNEYPEMAYQPGVLEKPEEPGVPFNDEPTPQQIAEHTPHSLPAHIFVGYSSRDTQYVEELYTHLAAEMRARKVVYWDDTEIQPGTVWRQEMRKYVQTADKAVLLVSAHFFASDFIIREELPQLLTLAKNKKLVIMSVIVRPCRFNNTDLAQFRTINPPSEPLSAMSPSKRDEVWVKVVEHINLAR